METETPSTCWRILFRTPRSVPCIESQENVRTHNRPANGRRPGLWLCRTLDLTSVQHGVLKQVGPVFSPTLDVPLETTCFTPYSPENLYFLFFRRSKFFIDIRVFSFIEGEPMFMVNSTNGDTLDSRGVKRNG